MNKPTIIFDLFGVIFSKGLKSSINKLSSVYNLPKIKISEAYQRWESPFDKGLINSQTFWSNINKELGKNINYKTLNKIVLSSYAIQPNTIKLVEFLKDYFTLIVFSNFRNEWFEVLDERYRISQLFEIVYISSEVGRVKPFYSTFDYIKNSLKINREDLCLIDDNPKNVLSFRKWGGKGIIFNDIFTTELNLRNYYQEFLPKYKERYSGVFLINKDETIIFQRRDDDDKIANPNMLSVFGGRAFKGETPIDCAMRELYEETTLKVLENDLTKIIELSYPLKYNNWIHCTYYKCQNFIIDEFFLKEGQDIEILSRQKAINHKNITKIPKFILKTVI